MKNPVIFWELASHDSRLSVDFFQTVFNWEFSSPDGILSIVDTSADGSGMSGGIFTLRKAKLPFLAIYILVDDIEAKAMLVENCGGLVTEPPHEIAGGAWICLFNDPSGVTFAMYQRPVSQ